MDVWHYYNPDYRDVREGNLLTKGENMKKLATLILVGMFLVPIVAFALAITPKFNPKYQVRTNRLPDGTLNYILDANGNKIQNPYCSSYKRSALTYWKTVCACEYPVSAWHPEVGPHFCFDSTKPEYQV